MTLQQAMDMALKRVGLLETTTTFEDEARLYANIVAKDIMSEAPWFWAYRTATLRTTRRLTITGASGTFTAGETVTDAQATAYSATVDSYDSTNGYLYVYSENAVTPTGTLTGGSSSATATYSSREYTRTYLLNANVDTLYYFVNETDGTTMSIIGAETYVERDPGRDDAGDGRAVVIEGLDADTNTGQIVVSLLPRHSTTNETIRYGYYQFISDWTSSNDSADLGRWIHPRVQPALVYGIARLYKQEKGYEEEATTEQNEYNKVISRAKEQQILIQGNRRYRKQGAMAPVSSNRPWDFRVPEGSLAAAS